MSATLAMIGVFELLFLLLVAVFLMGAVAVAVVLAVVYWNRRPKSVPSPAPAPSVPATRTCPRCGSTMSPDAPEGLCPACLFQHGIATEAGPRGPAAAFVPPSQAELAMLFPQLDLLELIGQGGMGAVYKARQPALDRFVALKILAPKGSGDLDFGGRFSREARALARLSHPNIVAVYDYGQVTRTPPASTQAQPANSPAAAETLSYFVMEYVDGRNLRQVQQSGRLSPREALEIVPQICAALQFAHDEGIVHRDIKPENILLDRKGRVKIADFGLAKILGQETQDFRLTGAKDIMGTPHYMAPEQVETPQEVDHRADIFSLGVVFYEMLTGQLPLGKFPPPSARVQVDVRLDEVVMRSLEREPERRYQQVSEVKTRVETIATSSGKEKTENRNPGVGGNPEFEGAVLSGAVGQRAASLIAVAILFIAAGLWDLLETVTSHGGVINPGILALPVGIGLLRLRPIWRGAALVCVWVTYLLLAIVFVHIFLRAFGMFGMHLWPMHMFRMRMAGTPNTTMEALFLLMSVAVVPWMHWVLMRRDVKGLFAVAGREPRRDWIEWSVVAVLLTVTGAKLVSSELRPFESATDAGKPVEAEPVASVVPVNDPMGGQVVEVVAIGSPTFTHRPWWLPDGEAAPEGFTFQSYGLVNSFEERSLGGRGEVQTNWFVFQAAPGITQVPQAFIGSSPAHVFSGLLSGGPARRGRIWMCVATFPVSQTETDFAIKVPAGPWRADQSMSDFESGELVRLKMVTDDLVWNVDVRLQETNGNVRLTGSHPIHWSDGWDHQLALIGAGGRVYNRSSDDSILRHGAITINELDQTYTNLTLENIREVRFRVRPYQTFRFEKIPLRPRSAAQPETPGDRSSATNGVPPPADRALTLARIVAANSAAVLSFRDIPGAAKILNTLSASEDVRFAILFDKERNALAQYVHPARTPLADNLIDAEKRLLPGLPSTGFSQTQASEPGLVITRVPVQVDDEILGYVVLGVRKP